MSGRRAPCTTGQSADATMPVVSQWRNVRARTEELERASLSTWSTRAAESKGRERHEEADPLRTVFQQDRDRLLHCRAFRRLHDKTHAFISTEIGVQPHRYRVRLTHTLEVDQIGRTIARGLRLNEDLVEAIALGHDLGHTAFSDAGEQAFSLFTEPAFHHHEQSLRVVERLERQGAGLNLTYEVRDGILHHPWTMPPPATAEGQVVRLANRIACLTHDLADALHSGMLGADELPQDLVLQLGSTHGARVNRLVSDVIAASSGQPDVQISPELDVALDQLEGVLLQRVYAQPVVRDERDKAVHCLESLVVYFLENPGRLPSAHHDDPLELRVVDYVAALGDTEALELFGTFFLPGG